MDSGPSHNRCDHGSDDQQDPSAAALLAAEEASVHARRAAAVEAMNRLVAWCDLHSIDPQTQPGAVPIRFGGERLILIGGEGTPGVAELCFHEFAIAGHTGAIATQHRAADYLDLRHRLPLLFGEVTALRVEVWVAAKVARLSRTLSKDAVALVDASVAAAAEESPARILTLAEAAVIEADPDAHRARIAADATRVGVWARPPRVGDKVEEFTAEAATAPLNAKLPLADREALVETLEHLAEKILHNTDTHEDGEDGQHAMTLDQARASALALLADPAAATRLLNGPDTDLDTQLDTELDTGQAPAAKPRRRSAVIYIHLHQTVLDGTIDAPARVEGLGPLLREQVADLLHGRQITVTPVIDLTHQIAVNAYEHPQAVKQRTLLRTTRDVFPHSTRQSTTRLDHDHPTPYRENGPPGQTGDHNDAPLARHDHRAKTHLGYHCEQLAPGTYHWTTPHGLTRLVTPWGTTTIGETSGSIESE